MGRLLMVDKESLCDGNGWRRGEGSIFSLMMSVIEVRKLKYDGLDGC